MSWFAWIGVLAALVIVSWVIVNAYGPIAFPSLVILWIGAFALASVLPGYLAKHGLELIGLAQQPQQPQQPEPMTTRPK